MNLDELKPNLLLVDDDRAFTSVMSSALRKRGFNVLVANDDKAAYKFAERSPLNYAVIDLCLGSETGLRVLQSLCQNFTDIKAIVLTGYANVETAVEAIKLGAIHYLTKPTDADEVVSALKGQKEEIQTLDEMEWSHIQYVLSEHKGNISAAARELNMHRRTLQRKIARLAP